MSFLSLRIPAVCMLALLAGMGMQNVHAKRELSGDHPVAVQQSLCENGVGALSRQGYGQALTDSRWLIKYKAEGEPQRRYIFRLLPDGRMRNGHPNDTTPNNDRWEADGRQIELLFNDGYAVYTGTLNSNAQQITGQATNRTGDRWSWTAVRLAPCAP